MTRRPPVWMFVLLGVQLALALGGLVFVTGLASAMAGHSVPFSHDDYPMFYPAVLVVVLGGAALLLWGRNGRAATILSLLPFPVAIALMAWAWM